jgi:hypothetical protein
MQRIILIEEVGVLQSVAFCTVRQTEYRLSTSNGHVTSKTNRLYDRNPDVAGTQWQTHMLHVKNPRRQHHPGVTLLV